MDLERLQQVLQSEGLDGWLFYDFRKSNPIAYQVLQLSLEEMYTRRWFYFVPARGMPTALISAVEPHVLAGLPGVRLIFRTWQELHAHLQSILVAGQRIAMEYSPMNAIPYVSRVDGGTLELVRSLGVEVVSSANLAQRISTQLSEAQLLSHREAGRRLIAVKDQVFAEVGAALQRGQDLDEFHVQQRFLELIIQAGLVTDEPPIVSVNANSGNPHYTPSSTQFSPIRRGDLVLFDFWASLPQPGALFADYTWVAFAGTREEIPQKQREVFEVVRRARDTGIAFIRERLAAGQPVQGYQVDDVTRGVIVKAGYGEYVVHRTGHSIGSGALHGNGANIDNFETRDERTLLPNTCNSIEPGVYLPTFGIRSEVDLLIQERDAEVTGVPIQEEIVPLLSSAVL
ncbi:MAG TPA: M24 family metallopeptidase [Ktedonobacteraceae bacterium]|nr:M24 family metallopeptidase [Ktedonobacteraceae bacterium]